MEKPEINTGNADTLKAGNVLLLKARKIAGGKVELTFVERIPTGSQVGQTNLVAYSMRYDERFSGGLTYCWMNTDVQAATEDYGVDFSDANSNWYLDQKGREVIDLNILNPVLNGFYIKVSIQETINPTDDQREFQQYKTRGKGGDPILHKGNHVWRSTIAVGVNNIDDKITHTLLESDPVGGQVILEGQKEMVGELETDEIGL